MTAIFDPGGRLGGASIQGFDTIDESVAKPPGRTAREGTRDHGWISGGGQEDAGRPHIGDRILRRYAEEHGRPRDTAKEQRSPGAETLIDDCRRAREALSRPRRVRSAVQQLDGAAPPELRVFRFVDAAEGTLPNQPHEAVLLPDERPNRCTSVLPKRVWASKA